jgi:AraC-like DNA-binding protein
MVAMVGHVGSDNREAGMSVRIKPWRDGSGARGAVGFPHPALRGLLDLYCGGTASAPLSPWLIPAQGAVPLNFAFAAFRDLPVVWTPGLQTRLLAASPTVGSACPCWASVKLTPLGAYRILGVPVAEFGGHVTDLEAVFGTDGRDLIEMVGDAGDWQRRFTVMERFFLSHARHGPAPAPEVARAWSRLVATDGRIRIEELAGDVGWSRKHLAKRFAAQVGQSPKTVARVIRFRTAFRRVAGGYRGSLADLAAECGFSDQAHLTRSFAEFGGASPVNVLSRLMPCGCMPLATGDIRSSLS